MTETALALAPEQIDLITRTVAKGCTKDELALFLHACQKSGLDPLMKQIYAVKRGGSMAIQAGIDGLRLVAERTGKYAPGREPTFTYLDGMITPPISATAYIKKMTPDGTWHEVPATAIFDEYCPRLQNGQPTQFWQKMPHVMLAKVAEALALRRAFPMELSGIYSTEEMTQADVTEAAEQKFKRLKPVKLAEGPSSLPPPADLVPPPPSDPAEETDTPVPYDLPISTQEHKALEAAIKEYADAFGRDHAEVRDRLKKKMALELGCEHFPDLTPEQFTTVMGWINAAWDRGK